MFNLSVLMKVDYFSNNPWSLKTCPRVTVFVQYDRQFNWRVSHALYIFFERCILNVTPILGGLSATMPVFRKVKSRIFLSPIRLIKILVLFIVRSYIFLSFKSNLLANVLGFRSSFGCSCYKVTG